MCRSNGDSKQHSHSEVAEGYQQVCNRWRVLNM